MNKYHAEHTWVRIEGDTALVGITQHAQDTLGDIVFVDFAEVGKSFGLNSILVAHEHNAYYKGDIERFWKWKHIYNYIFRILQI